MLSLKNRCCLSILYQNTSAFVRPTVYKLQKRNFCYYENETIDSSAGKRLVFRIPEMRTKQALYGGKNTITMLRGDGVGPEVLDYVKTVFKHLRAPIAFDEVEINKDSSDKVLEEAVYAVRRNGVAIKGNLETLPGASSKNLVLREALDLFGYVQRCYSFPGVKTRHSNIDVAIIRENTEGEYSRVRIAKFAFEYARAHKRRKVTAVHKANIMKLGDGLFLKSCDDMSKDYPDIEFNSIIVDNCCMQLVSNPQQFDVMVMPNLYGNIVGNVLAGLIGGAGLTAGVNIGDDCAVFESGTRNSGRSLVGKNVANPIALLLASSNMLEYLGHKDEGRLMRMAVYNTTENLGLRTVDIGGKASTTEMMDAILSYIDENID